MQGQVRKLSVQSDVVVSKQASRRWLLNLNDDKVYHLNKNEQVTYFYSPAP